MKKTVLFLMNGFGIEQIGSYNVYNDKLMPNLDKYTKEYLFSSIDTKSFDMISGYRKFSLGLDIPLTYSLIDNYQDKFDKNPNINLFLNNIKENSKIQLYLFLENEKSFEHIKSFIKFIRKTKDNKMLLHLILTSKDDKNYKEVERILNKFIYDYKECSIASIVGLNTLTQTNLISYMNLLKNEVGEKWRELNRKFTSLTQDKILPIDVKEFYVNEGFKLESDDVFFFFNYEYTNLTNLVSNLSNCYSLFQINGIKYSMFAYPKSNVSMANSLKKINTKSVILTNKQNIGLINYYCCGLENVSNDSIVYGNIDNNLLLNQEYIKSVIDNPNYNLIIIDYHIDDAKDVKELTDKLISLDYILGYIHDYIKEKEYSLFISSLYGMKKELPLDNFTKALVDFSSKVPFLVIDKVFTKTNFRIDFGDTYNLAHTVYTNINKEYDINAVLIKKKGIISKLLKK